MEVDLIIITALRQIEASVDGDWIDGSVCLSVQLSTGGSAGIGFDSNRVKL